MNSPRVAHLTSAHDARDVRILFKECVSLAEAGYSVTLIASGGEDGELEGVRLLGAPPRRGGRLQRMTRASWQVIRRALQGGFDVCHLHDPELLGWAPLLRARGCRVIFDMHENQPRYTLHKDWVPRPLRPGLAEAMRLGERVLLQGVGVVFAEASYPPDYPWVSPSVVVQNMPLVDDLVRMEIPEREIPTLAYVGFVAPGKGSVKTLEAMASLRRKGLDMRLECVGYAPSGHLDELEALAGRLDLDGVRLHGFVPHPEAAARIAGAHIGLAVLDRSPNYVESYPTKVFEYMALGMAVVVSDFPMYRSVVEEGGCGVCVDPDDPDALAEAIEALVADPEETRRMGERGRRLVQERYAWKNEAKKLIRFYQDHVGPPGDPP